VEQTSSFTVFYVKLFPIGCIKKNEKLKLLHQLKSDLVFMKKIAKIFRNRASATIDKE